jgi:hypothetical protein
MTSGPEYAKLAYVVLSAAVPSAFACAILPAPYKHKILPAVINGALYICTVFNIICVVQTLT